MRQYVGADPTITVAGEEPSTGGPALRAQTGILPQTGLGHVPTSVENAVLAGRDNK